MISEEEEKLRQKKLTLLRLIGDSKALFRPGILEFNLAVYLTTQV